MSTPHTGDRQFRDDVVRIAALTVNTSVIEDLEFSNCRIIGPAVLALLDGVSLIGCRWDAPDLEAIFWEVPPSRPRVVGAVGVQRCVFSNCSFAEIGLAGPPDLRQLLQAGFN